LSGTISSDSGGVMFKKICLLVLGALLIAFSAFGGVPSNKDYKGIDFDAFQVQVWERGKLDLQEFQIQGFEGLHVDYHEESVYIALKSKPQKISKARSKSYAVGKQDMLGLMIRDHSSGSVFKLENFTVHEGKKGTQYRFSSKEASAQIETDPEGRFQKIVFAYEKKPGGISHYLKLSEVTNKKISNSLG